jgi:hypothetical protein
LLTVGRYKALRPPRVSPHDLKMNRVLIESGSSPQSDPIVVDVLKQDDGAPRSSAQIRRIGERIANGNALDNHGAGCPDLVALHCDARRVLTRSRSIQDCSARLISAGSTGLNSLESGGILGKRRTVAIKSQFSRLSPHGVTM